MASNDRLKVFIFKTLPSLSKDKVEEIMEAMRDLGIESEDDLRFIRESDLDGILKPIQARKLMEGLKGEPATENEPDKAAGHDVKAKTEIKEPLKQTKTDGETGKNGHFSDVDMESDDDNLGNHLNGDSPAKNKKEPRFGGIGSTKNTPNNECNILILGETGVGKSTFINAFANYMKYSSLEEAEDRDLVSLIPTSFTVTDKDYTEKHIKFGSDANESGRRGASQTQSCREYTFKVSDLTVRLIDTPGVGDTSGIDQDTENFRRIMAFIKQYSVLNGILILLKPNNARLSILFRFCIQELLGHLHKSASRNIVFLFTNARSTFYRPGDTLPSLRDLLERNEKNPPYVRITLDLSTIYCLDNESFRFLVALKSDVEFSNDEKKNFVDSWNKSVEECQRLMLYVTNLLPHAIDETVSLYEAKQIVCLLAKPLCDISIHIQNNIQVAQDQQKKIQQSGDDMSKLKEALYVPHIDLKAEFFKQPRTVCTSSQCVTIRTVAEGRTVTDYTTSCHDPCYLEGVTAELVNNTQLLNCAAMNGTQKCKNCECGYEMHMHVYYKNVETSTEKIDSNVELELKTKGDIVREAERVLQECEFRIIKQKNEQKKITEASAQIACFLKANSISLVNDATMDYLDHLIKVEKDKCALDPSNKTKVKRLKRVKQEYEGQLNLLKDSLKNSSEPKEVYSPKMIRDLQNELFSLEINGDYIRQAFEGQQHMMKHEKANLNKNPKNKPVAANAGNASKPKKRFNWF